MIVTQTGAINIWDVLNSLLETGRGGLERFGTHKPMVVIYCRGKEPDIYERPNVDVEQFYRKMQTLSDDPDCIVIGQLQNQKFTRDGELLNAVTVSVLAENVGRAGLAQPFHKTKERYRFEIPIEVGEAAGGLDSADYIWHHIADRWTTPVTIAAAKASLAEVGEDSE